MECALNAGCVPVFLGNDAGPDEFVRFPPRFSYADELTLFRAIEALR
jgi:hypothetical protein